MSNLLIRILSALVLGPVALLALWVGGLAFWAMIAGVVALGLREWLRLVRTPDVTAPAIGAALAGLAVGAVAGFGWGLAILIAGAAAIAATARAGMAGFGLLYLGVPGLCLIWLRDIPVRGWALVLFVFLVVWATDIGGYAAGRIIGGRRLAPRISPGKTWAGFIGAVAAAAVVGGAALWVAHGFLLGVAGAVLGAFISVVAQAGDLLESALKRRYDTKDSGSLIPGHGGVLDRIDGLLAAAPVFAIVHILTQP